MKKTYYLNIMLDRNKLFVMVYMINNK